MATQDEIKRLQLDVSQVTRTQSILNTNQIQKIWNSTPQRYKYSRPAKGGGDWTYIKISYVRKVLDSVFGFNWSFDIETTLPEAFEVAKITKGCVVKGTLSGKVWFDGQWVEIKKTQFGRAEVKLKKGTELPLDFGNDMKAAASDCLKKCASLFGIGADVYEAGEFMEIELIGSEEHSAKAKATKKKIKEAEAILKSPATPVGEQNEQHS